MNKHLIIDHGNSRLKIGFFTEGKLLNVELLDALQPEALFELTEAFAPEAILYAATSHDDAEMIARLREYATLIVFDTEVALPFAVKYESRATAGADRLANIAAGCVKFGYHPFLIVDLGTCVTYDLYDGEAFIGGAISPGLLMRMKAMEHYTSRLPLVDARKVALTGTRTEDAMRSGGFNGWNFEVKAMIEAYRNERNNLQVALTGGDLSYFDRADKSLIFADPYWTLRGYSEILRFNAH